MQTIASYNTAGISYSSSVHSAWVFFIYITGIMLNALVYFIKHHLKIRLFPNNTFHCKSHFSIDRNLGEILPASGLYNEENLNKILPTLLVNFLKGILKMEIID